MNGYYNDKLAADKLRRCYEIAPLRVQQYLQAEIDYVLQQLGVDDTVLELVCGYGRVLKQLSQKAREVVGIDTSLTSLQLARQSLTDNLPVQVTISEVDKSSLFCRLIRT